jgi:solute carrier family 25 carnitine/acylcarnitine transporter 20/29
MSSTTEKIKEKAQELEKKIPSASEAVGDVKEVAVEATSSLVHSLRALAAGGVGGVCAVLTGHPFDLVKVHLQTAEKGRYNGAIDVVKKIMAKNGPKGLYAGVTAPLFGVTPMFAISFWVCYPDNIGEKICV